MQELNLCQDIISMISERSLSKSFRKVKRIQLEIGEFTQVNKHAISFCFEQASRGTLAEGAKLEFIDIPASAICGVCKKIFLIKTPKEPCHHCEAPDIKLLSGNELGVRKLEVE